MIYLTSFIEKERRFKMIQKIKRIGNFGVFNSFDWGAEVLDKNGNALSFR